MNKKIIILLMTLFVFLIYLIIRNPKEPVKLSTDTFSENHPIIKYPIECDGNKEIEFNKRNNDNPTNQESEAYISVYQNRWDDNVELQTFNLLSEDQDQVVGKYPNNIDMRFKNLFIPESQFLRNYLESLSYYPVEIALHGRGYYFYDESGLITLYSTKSFFQADAKNGESCFDDGSREVYIDLTDFDNLGLKLTAFRGYENAKIYFSKFTPQYCNTYSFLETSKDVFLICLSSKNIDDLTYAVLGFAYDEFNTDVVPTKYPATLTMSLIAMLL
jgi:hypothetical protein